MKQIELRFVFALALAGALGTAEAQKEIPTGIKQMSKWVSAALTAMQEIPPLSSAPERKGDAHLLEMPISFCIPRTWARTGAGKVSR